MSTTGTPRAAAAAASWGATSLTPLWGGWVWVGGCGGARGVVGASEQREGVMGRPSFQPPAPLCARTPTPHTLTAPHTHLVLPTHPPAHPPAHPLARPPAHPPTHMPTCLSAVLMTAQALGEVGRSPPISRPLAVPFAAPSWKARGAGAARTARGRLGGAGGGRRQIDAPAHWMYRVVAVAHSERV